MTKLTKHEIQILKECAGILPPSPWGAWVGACMSVLTGLGLLTRAGKLTEKGRSAIKEILAEEPSQ